MTPETAHQSKTTHQSVRKEEVHMIETWMTENLHPHTPSEEQVVLMERFDAYTYLYGS